ncbi:hypothetical protein JW859_14600 [bacterium]|nr:hypothetical protein [bacterium]
MQKKIIQRLQTLGIEELTGVSELNVLQGSYVNLEALLPNGDRQKILRDDKTYLGCQVEIENSAKCYGIAADENQIAVFRYGCGGSEAELVHWLTIA